MASDTSQLSDCLTDDELSSLSESTSQKLSAYLKEKDQCLHDARAAVEKIRVVSDQQCFELEKQLQDNIQKLEAAQSVVRDYEAKNGALDSQLKSCCIELEEVKKSTSSNQIQLQEIKTQNEIFASEKQDLLTFLEKRSREIETLNEDYKSVTTQLSTLTTEKYKALARVDELTSEDAILRQSVSRLEQEKDSLLKQVEHLNVEVSQTSQRLYSTRSEQGHKLVELQAKLNDVAEQLRLAVSVKESAQQILEEQNEKHESQSLQIKQLKDSHIKAEEQFQHQLQMQMKLAHLYKSSLEESQERVTELTNVIEEMQQLLKQAADESKTYQEGLDNERTKWEVITEEKESQIVKLKEALSKSQLLLEQSRKQVLSDEEVSCLSPGAAAVSRILKSGKSLTEIYGEYVGAVEQLQAANNENDRLNMYLNQILREIEEKAPALKKQREDYEKSLGTITHLTGKLNTAILDHDRMEFDLSDMKRKFAIVQKENEKINKTAADLGQQLCVLLREVEIAKGRNLPSGDHDENNSVSSSTASLVITENLVTFKDVLELQAQNQKLLAVVRELGEKHEEESRETEDKKLIDLQNELKQALQEVEELRGSRDRQKELVEAIVRQRDMYRVLLNQANQNILSGESATSEMGAKSSPSVVASISPQKVSHEEHSTLQSSYQKLQEAFTQYKTQSAENIKVMQEQMDQVKNDRMELRLQTAKLTSQLEFLNERCITMRRNIDGYKKEVAALVTRNQQLSVMTAKQEESISFLRNELMSCQEKLAKSEVTLENVQLERSLLQQAEIRFKAENEILRREQSGQALLMANLQAIQNNLEKSDSESKMQQQNRISLLEKEVVAARSKLDREVERSRTMQEAFEKERIEFQNKLQVEIEKHCKTRDELVTSYGSLHEARQEIVLAEEKLKAVESSVLKEHSRTRQIKLSRPSTHSGSDRDDEESPLLLAETQAEIKALKSQLEQSRQHLSQFKSIASSLEEQLKEQNETSSKIQSNAENTLKEKTEEILNLTKELERLKATNASMTLEGAGKTAEDASQVELLRQELAAVRTELQGAMQACEESKQKEELARRDLLEQVNSAQEAKDNYQRELMLHASDIKTLESLKNELEGFNAKLAAAQEVAQNAEFALKSSKISSDSRESLLKEQVEQLTSKCQELERQNTVVHEQMERMSIQMVGVQSKTSAAAEETKYSSNQVDGNSNEQLLEIIKYLRKEREIANTKCDLSTAENQRLTTKVDYLQARLDEVNRSLTELQQKEQVTLSTSTQHTELLRKVELLNVLTDGNRLLREEKTKLEDLLKESSDSVNKLNAELLPLREKNRELVAQCEALQAERKAIEGEAKRWQARTQQLTGMRSEKESVQTELRTAKDDVLRLTEEVAVKESRILEMNRTVLQVRMIGRKYKTQYDEVKAQYDELAAKHQESERKAAEVAAQPVPNVTEVVDAAKQEVRQELEAKIKEYEENSKACDDKIKKLRQTAYQRIMLISNQRDKHQKEVEELKAKVTSLEQTHQSDVINVKSQLETKVKELESKLEESRSSTKMATQEKANYQNEIDTLSLKVSAQQKLIETLQAKLKESSNIKLSAVASSSRESSILSQSSVDSGTPPTANIKPMATTPGATVVRHSHPVNQPSRPTPMGRIRPITPFSQSSTRMAAIPPTTASSSLTQQQQQDVSEAESASVITTTTSTVSVPHAAIAPTPAIHAVLALAPTISSENLQQQQHHHVATFLEAPSSTLEASDGYTESNDLPQDLSVAGTSAEPPTDDVHSGSEVAGPSSEPSVPAPPVILKRQRVEDNDSELSSDKAMSKRVKSDMEEFETATTSLICVSSSEETFEQQNTVDEKDSSIDCVIPTDDDSELEIIVVVSDEDGEEDENDENEDAGDDGDDEDVDGEGDVDLSVEEQMTEAPEVGGEIDEDYSEEDTMTEEYPDEASEKMDQEQFQDVAEEMVEDDDVEIIEQEAISETIEEEGEPEITVDDQQPMDDNSNLQGSSEPMEQQPILVQPLSVPIQRQAYISRMPPRADRLPSLNRQQPASFPVMGGNSGGFEDGDSIVPSTPTLFDPRRNDGFAEAVSSPQVPPERFLFGSSMETPSQLASQGALGVDDTRMDLTQLDESSGRSVPSTPLQVSPPEAVEGEGVPGEAVSITIQDVTEASAESGADSVPEAEESSISVVVDEPVEVLADFGDPADVAACSVNVTVSSDAATTSEAPSVTLATVSAVVPLMSTLPLVPLASGQQMPDSPSRTENQLRQIAQNRGRGMPIVWDRPRGAPRGRGGVFARGGANGNRPFVRRMRVMGHPIQGRMGRHFSRGGGTNRGHRYPRS